MGLRNAEMSILEVLLASMDAMEIDTTPWNPLVEPESEWKKHIAEWPSILFGQFLSYVIM